MNVAIGINKKPKRDCIYTEMKMKTNSICLKKYPQYFKYLLLRPLRNVVSSVEECAFMVTSYEEKESETADGGGPPCFFR